MCGGRGGGGVWGLRFRAFEFLGFGVDGFWGFWGEEVRFRDFGGRV